MINPKIKLRLNAKSLTLRLGCSGTLFCNEPIVCGGYYRNSTVFEDLLVFEDCLVFGENNLQLKMLQKRASAALVILRQNKLWIVGGWNGSGDLDTTEFLTLNNVSEEGPKLPFKISSHCMFNYNENSILIIGGMQNGSRSKKTWILDPTNEFNIKEGPTLNVERHQHSCAKFQINGKPFILVIGGRDGCDSILDSVEFLDLSLLGQQNWIMGKRVSVCLGSINVHKYFKEKSCEILDFYTKCSFKKKLNKESLSRK